MIGWSGWSQTSAPSRPSSHHGPSAQTGGRHGACPSPEGIVDAALVVLDREGLDGFSMRAVAEELGTGAGSLYWHVRGKEELLNLMVDRVIGALEVPDPDPPRWQ